MIHMGDDFSRKNDWSTIPQTVLDESKKMTDENTDDEALTVTNDIINEAANEEMMMSMYEKGILQPEDL